MMRGENHPYSETGAALVISLIASVVVALSAVVVLNTSYQRYYLSVFQKDHSVAFNAAEGGIRYAFARMRREGLAPGTLQQRVRDAAGAWYIVACHQNPNPPAVHERDDRLHMGIEASEAKHVLVRVRFRGPAADPPYEVQADADYAQWD